MIRPYLAAPDTAEEITAAFQEDVIGFLCEYLERKDLTFQAFRDLWASRKFSLLHHCCPGFCDRSRYIQQLFGSAATLLAPAIKLKQGDHPLPTSLAWKIGVVYVLYCLYHTQIVAPREGIRISPPTRNRLRALFQQLSKMGPLAEDALCILSKLELEECFVCAAYEGPVSYEKALSNRLHDSQDFPDVSAKASLEMNYIYGSDVLQLAHDMKKYESCLGQTRKSAEGKQVVEGPSLPDILCQKLLWMGEKPSIPPKFKPLPQAALAKKRTAAEEEEARAEEEVPSDISRGERAETPKKKKRKKFEDQKNGWQRAGHGDEGIIREQYEDLEALALAERRKKILETKRLREQMEVTPGDADDLAELFAVPDQRNNEDVGLESSSEEEMESWKNAGGSEPAQGARKERSSRPTKAKPNRKSRKDEQRITQLSAELEPQQLGAKGRDEGNGDLEDLIDALNDQLDAKEKKKVLQPARRKSTTSRQVAGGNKRLNSAVDKFLGRKKLSGKSAAEDEGDPLFAQLQSELQRGGGGQSHGGSGGSVRAQKRTYNRKSQGRGTEGNAARKGGGAISLLDIVGKMPAQSNEGLQVGEREFRSSDTRQELQAPAEMGQRTTRSGRGREGGNGGVIGKKRGRHEGSPATSPTASSSRGDDDIFAALEAERNWSSHTRGSETNTSKNKKMAKEAVKDSREETEEGNADGVRPAFGKTVESRREDEELFNQLSSEVGKAQDHHQSSVAEGGEEVDSSDDEAIFAKLSKESRKESEVVDSEDDEALLAHFEKHAQKKSQDVNSEGDEALLASLNKELRPELENIGSDDDHAIFASLEKERTTKPPDPSSQADVHEEDDDDDDDIFAEIENAMGGS